LWRFEHEIHALDCSDGCLHDDASIDNDDGGGDNDDGPC
jgi:hypothetical protein